VKVGVTSAGTGVDSQTRAYAEYRFVSRLAEARDRISDAEIALLGWTGAGRASEPMCAISITLRAGGLVRAAARGPHIYHAIDRAVEGAAEGVQTS
jgi:hypothetical protein